MPSNEVLSESKRPIPLRLRADLEAQELRFGTGIYWVVRDPIGIHSYRFHEEEYALLSMLDGKRSLSKIQQRFHQLFPPQRLTFPDFKNFLWRSLDCDILISDTPGHQRRLLQRKVARQRARRLSMISDPSRIILFGWNPERLLRYLQPAWQKLVSPAALLLGLLLTFSVLFVAWRNSSDIWARLPAMSDILHVSSLPGLVLAFVLVKSVHELGHMLAKNELTGHCEQSGVMMYLGIPFLFADIAESLWIDSKRNRVFVVAAGVYVDCLIAVTAGLGWWFTAPGYLHAFFLYVGTIAVIGMLLNVNPLLTGDGYRILAILTDTPWLARYAAHCCSTFFAGLLCGPSKTKDPFLPSWRKTLALFGFFRLIAKIVVIVAGLWALAQIARSTDVQVLFLAVPVAAFALFVVRPAWAFARFIAQSHRESTISRPRVIATSILLLGVAGLLTFVSVPEHVHCSVTIAASKTQGIRMPGGGRVERIVVQPGQTVSKNQAIVQVKLDDQPDAGLARINAPDAGRVMPIRSTANIPQSGFAEDYFESLIGQHFLRGQPLFQLVSSKQALAVCHLDQKDLGLVRAGQPIEIRLDAAPDMDWQTTVDQVVVSRRPIGVTDVAAGVSATAEIELLTSWHAIASIQDAQAITHPGLKGRARVLVGHHSVGLALWLKMRETIRRLFA